MVDNRNPFRLDWDLRRGAEMTKRKKQTRKGGSAQYAESTKNAIAQKKAQMTIPSTPESVVPAKPQEKPADTIGNTRRWARQCHGSQTDKAGFPYVCHLDAVALGVYRLVGLDMDLIKAAYLHDFIEDTTGTTAMLRENGYSEKVIETVYDVTKVSGEPNYDYISFIIRSENTGALVVKLADLYHNTLEVRMEHKSITVATRERLEKKYLPAIWRIERTLRARGMDVPETVTFEQALAACKPKSSYEPKWRDSTSPATVVAGDYMKFSEDTDEKFALRVKSKISKGTETTFTFHDSASKITLKSGDKFWVKWGGGTQYGPPSTTSYTPEWIKYMGLPPKWEEGDPLPDPEEVFQYSTYTSTKRAGSTTAKKTSKPKGVGPKYDSDKPKICPECHIYKGHTTGCSLRTTLTDLAEQDLAEGEVMSYDELKARLDAIDEANGTSKALVVVNHKDSEEPVDDTVVVVTDPETGEYLGTVEVPPIIPPAPQQSFEELMREVDDQYGGWAH
jgi:hypothetical protein